MMPWKECSAIWHWNSEVGSLCSVQQLSINAVFTLFKISSSAPVFSVGPMGALAHSLGARIKSFSCSVYYCFVWDFSMISVLTNFSISKYRIFFDLLWLANFVNWFNKGEIKE